ncbi:MAG: hypothetical protein QM765_28880 [Myxococcales bacterium]
MSRRLCLSFCLLLAACAHRGETLPAEDRDAELDAQELRSFCDRWRSLGSPTDPSTAFARARLALAERHLPLKDGACLTRAQLGVEAVAAAQVATKRQPDSSEAWLTLSQCLTVFAGDRPGAAGAACKAAELQRPASAAASQECGDLFFDAGRNDEARQRWRAALAQENDDSRRYGLIARLTAAGEDPKPLLAELSPQQRAGYEQWKEARLRERVKPEPERSGPLQDSSDGVTETEKFNERVRTRMREMLDEEN